VRGLLVIAAALASAGCAESPTGFAVERARRHVEVLGRDIGSRPVGSPANAAARAYLSQQLTALGFDTRIQSAVAHNPRGVTGLVQNVIGTLDGQRAEAVVLVAHYDSVSTGSGAVDDALGTATVMEAARALASRGRRHWSLIAILTDGEEEGLLGAEAAVVDPEIRRRAKVVLNLEAMGGGTPVMLFETGPGNKWLVDAWARSAPAPRGASFTDEIYRRMPNDTDFSVFRRAGIPGLNFSAIGDAYSYHTSLEHPERVADAALLQAGATTVALVDALEREDITRRSSEQARYVDLCGVAALSWSAGTDRGLGVAALGLGLLALIRAAAGLWRAGGPLGLTLTLLWTGGGALVAVAAAVGCLALLRGVREVYHPWYSHPLRFALAIALSATAAAWVVARLSAHLPERWRPPRSPLAAMVPTLGAWVPLAAAAAWAVPGAAFLWTAPLLALAGPVAFAGTGTAAVAVAAVAAAVVAAVLWVRDLVVLIQFMVTLLGGLPLITPIWVLPALVVGGGVMVAPPLIAAAMAAGARRPRFITRVLLVTTGFSVAWAYDAPAYTPERPLRMALVSVSGEAGGTVRLVTANEPVPPLGQGPDALTPSPAPPARFARYIGGAPFVAIATPQPARTALPTRCEVTGDAVTIEVDGADDLDRVRLELPDGLAPIRADPAGVVVGGRWRAALVGDLTAGATFRLTLPADAARACGGRLLVQRRVSPGAALLAAGTQPAATWHARLVDVLPLR
jgi:hypothetical protein